MKATKVTKNGAALPIEEAVNFAVDAAQEAYDAVKRQRDSTEYEANKAAREAYRNCMPVLETAVSVKCFIASVAKGIALGFIDNEEGRLMMYGAQVWLQVEAGKPAAVLQ